MATPVEPLLKISVGILEDFGSQKQVSRAWIINYIPQYSVGCNYLSRP